MQTAERKGGMMRDFHEMSCWLLMGMICINTSMSCVGHSVSSRNPETIRMAGARSLVSPTHMPGWVAFSCGSLIPSKQQLKASCASANSLRNSIRPLLLRDLSIKLGKGRREELFRYGRVKAERSLPISMMMASTGEGMGEDSNHNEMLKLADETGRRLFVSHLSPHTDELRLFVAFEPFHGLTEAKIIKPGSLAYVLFEDVKSASRAYEKMHGVLIDGHEITVRRARSFYIRMEEQEEMRRAAQSMVAQARASQILDQKGRMPAKWKEDENYDEEEEEEKQESSMVSARIQNNTVRGRSSGGQESKDTDSNNSPFGVQEGDTGLRQNWGEEDDEDDEDIWAEYHEDLAMRGEHDEWEDDGSVADAYGTLYQPSSLKRGKSGQRMPRAGARPEDKEWNGDTGDDEFTDESDLIGPAANSRSRPLIPRTEPTNTRSESVNRRSGLKQEEGDKKAAADKTNPFGVDSKKRSPSQMGKYENILTMDDDEFEKMYGVPDTSSPWVPSADLGGGRAKTSSDALGGRRGTTSNDALADLMSISDEEFFAKYAPDDSVKSAMSSSSMQTRKAPLDPKPSSQAGGATTQRGRSVDMTKAAPAAAVRGRSASRGQKDVGSALREDTTVGADTSTTARSPSSGVKAARSRSRSASVKGASRDSKKELAQDDAATSATKNSKLSPPQTNPVEAAPGRVDKTRVDLLSSGTAAATQSVAGQDASLPAGDNVAKAPFGISEDMRQAMLEVQSRAVEEAKRSSLGSDKENKDEVWDEGGKWIEAPNDEEGGEAQSGTWKVDEKILEERSILDAAADLLLQGDTNAFQTQIKAIDKERLKRRLGGNMKPGDDSAKKNKKYVIEEKFPDDEEDDAAVYNEVIDAIQAIDETDEEGSYTSSTNQDKDKINEAKNKKDTDDNNEAKGTKKRKS